jgi:hypothetical protein
LPNEKSLGSPCPTYGPDTRRIHGPSCNCTKAGLCLQKGGTNNYRRGQKIHLCEKWKEACLEQRGFSSGSKTFTNSNTYSRTNSNTYSRTNSNQNT